MPKNKDTIKEPDDMENIPSKELSKRFRYFRKYKKLSQLDLAEALGIYQSTISYYDNGERSIPVDIIVKLHNTFGMDLNWFFTGVGKPTDKPDKRNITTDLASLRVTCTVLEDRINTMNKQIVALTRELFAMKHGQ